MKKLFTLSILLLSIGRTFAQCSVTTTQANITCNGGCNGSATAISSGQSPFTYLWAPTGQTAATATGLCAGNYTVTVTDANNCTGSTTVFISQPAVFNVSASSTGATCFGNCDGTASVTASGGTLPYTFMWMPSNQFFPTISNLCAGTYTVTATDANGCTGTAITAVTQPAQLNPALVNSTSTICGNCNAYAVITASGGVPPYFYSWSNGQTGSTATGLCAGSYTCYVTDANLCMANIMLTITNTPVLYDSIVSSGATCSSCPDGWAAVYPMGGSGPYMFQWSTGQSAATSTGMMPGTYSVTVTDMNGCTVNNTVTIQTGNSCSANFYTYPDTGNSSIQYTVNMAGGAQPLTYTWNWGDGSPDDYTAYPTHTYTSTGSYTICLNITDNLGCNSSYCNGVTVARMAAPTTLAPVTMYVIPPPNMTSAGITSAALQGWNIAPNPVDEAGVVTYTLNAPASVSVTLFDILGNKIVNLENTASRTAGTHPVHFTGNDLAPGIYLVKIDVNGQQDTKRVMIVK